MRDRGDWARSARIRGMDVTGRRAVINAIAIAVGVYSALVGALYFLQRGLIYHPSDHLPPPAASQVPEMRPVAVHTDDGLTLVSWYAPARGGRPTIVYFHGNAGNIAGRGFKVRPFLDAGLGVLLAEYRGYGGNPGSPTEDGLYADGRANLDFLAGEGVPPGKTVLYGESLGTGIAVRLAAEHARSAPVGAVILESPFDSLAETAAIHYPFVPARTLVRDRFPSIDKIAGIKAPVLFMHAEDDAVVPIRQGKRLFEAAREPKEAHWIAGAGHNSLHDFDIAGKTLEFIERHLSRPPG